MKDERLPPIIFRGPGIEKCSIEGCKEIATAFLEEASESAGRRIVKKSTPFCKQHALEKHEQIIRGEFDRSGQTPIYQPETYEKPHKKQ